jgi:hypothetical protein
MGFEVLIEVCKNITCRLDIAQYILVVTYTYLSSKIHCVLCQKKVILITFFMDKGIILNLTTVYFPFPTPLAFLELNGKYSQTR